MIQYVWLIPTIMALAALVNGLGVRRLGKFAGYISTGAMALTFLLAAAIFFEVKGIQHATEEKYAALPEAERFAMIAETFNAEGRVVLWNWLDIPSAFGTGRDLKVEFAFHVDSLTAIFLLFISFIGTLVFLYANGYMKEKAHAHHGHDDHGHGHDDHGHDAHDDHAHAGGDHHHGFGHGPMYQPKPAQHDGEYTLDPGFARFFAYVALFAASMYILILGANLPMMFIGWEGVGLCSYLLIGYFFDKPFSENLSCADAGRKAFVYNRVGDFGLMLGMFLLYWGLGTMDFHAITTALTTGRLANGAEIPAEFFYGGVLATAAALLLFLGATGKSAQIPLFCWLPDAMAGPTPVSALIHAATMVTAGVYMVARLNVLFTLSPAALAVIAIIGALTAFVAAFAGLTQRGIKKALAYSTVSQLGFMFLAMGVGAYAAGIFHVFTHAFFKGCLFLCAGSVIHALHHEEDMYKMGGLKKKMPVTALTYFLAMLCIAGFPLTSGFFSKDEILYKAFVSADGNFPVLYAIGLATAAMTAIYMARSYYLTFEGESRVDPHLDVHESPKSMTTPLILLAGLAMVVGFLNVPAGIIPLGDFNAAFHHFLAPVTDRGPATFAKYIPGYGEHHHTLELILACVSGGMAILLVFGFARAYYTNGVEREGRLARTAQLLFSVSLNRWWWDDFYNHLFRDGTMMTARGVLRFDQKIIDGVVNGLGRLSRAIGDDFRRLQNGQTQIYGLVMILGAVAFLLYFALGFQLTPDAYAAKPMTPPAARVAPAANAVVAVPATAAAATNAQP